VCRHAVALFKQQENKDGLLAALESLALAALATGPDTREAGGDYAARLLGAVEALREALALPGPDWWRRPGERIRETVRAAALEPECAAAWAEGRAMSLEQALARALEEPLDA
jgi:hypothetical protein